MKLRELPENERPREKLIYRGKSSLSNAELIAILIRTGSRDMSALRLAEKLLSMDKNGIFSLGECSVEELCAVKGIGKAKACQISAAMELGRRVAATPRKSRQRIKSSGDIAGIYMEEMRYCRKEYFNAVMLNAKKEIIASENIAIGDLCSSIVHPREAFLCAVKRSAAGIIFMHNHPSGDPKPSKEDIDVTRRLCETGRILGISVLDHIIIGDGIYISLKEQGLI